MKGQWHIGVKRNECVHCQEGPRQPLWVGSPPPLPLRTHPGGPAIGKVFLEEALATPPPQGSTHVLTPGQCEFCLFVNLTQFICG